MNLKTDVDLAEIMGVTVEDVHLKCRGEWPCVKPKRSVWRFTDAMVEQIIAMESVAPAKKPATASARSQRGRRAS